MKPTFDCEEAQVVYAPFVDEVIRVHKPVHDGDLMGIEEESKRIVVQLTSLRVFMSSLKHLVKTPSEEETVTTVAPIGVLSGGDR